MLTIRMIMALVLMLGGVMPPLFPGLPESSVQLDVGIL